MYSFVLFLHSILRWLVLATGVLAVAKAASAPANRPTTGLEEKLSGWFVASMDLQLLLGLLLYGVLSPFTTEAFGDMGAAMRNGQLRFWVVEHPLMMIIAVVLAHVGRARSKRVADPRRRRRAVTIFYTLALLAVLASIPWPGTANGRPFFRLPF